MKKMVLLLMMVAAGGWFYSSYQSEGQADPSSVTQETAENSQRSSLSNTNGEQTEQEVRGEMLDFDRPTDAIYLYRKGEFERAIALLKKDLTDPKHMATKDRQLAYIARSQEYLDQEEKAKTTWEKLISEYPQSRYLGDAYYFLAKYNKKKDLRNATIEMLKKASRYYDKSVGGNKASYILGELYYHAGKDAWLRSWQMFSRVARYTRNRDDLQKAQERVNEITEYLVFSSKPIPMSSNYQVQSGDYLSKIARKHNTSVGLIQKINGITNPRSLRIGQRLKILPGALQIEVRKRLYALGIFLESGLLLKGFSVGLGREDKTPETDFVIETKQEKPAWYKSGPDGTIRIPYGDPRNVLGEYWLGFNKKPEASGFGIHGTVDPDSIGKNRSDGCIRLLKDNLRFVYEVVPRGTKVVIRDW